MRRLARVHCLSLRSSLVNLPISIYGSLVNRNIRPQSLAVHLSHPQSNAQAFLGWTGMASASSLAQFNSSTDHHETIEIDPQYAQALGFSQGDIVEIGLLHDLPLAKSVATEPLSSDDWEIIEIHASNVESTLLSQVRVANVGQEVDVWILGHTRVRLRVLSLEPQLKPGPLILTTDTEITVAPKSHRPPRSSTSVTSISNPIASQPDVQKASPQLLRVLPSRLLPQKAHNYHPDKTFALLSPHSFAQLTSTHIPLSDGSVTYHRCTIMCVPPPSDPTATNNTKAAEDGGDQIELYVGWNTLVPPRHVTPFFVGARNEIEEWSIVKITLLNGGEADTVFISDANDDSKNLTLVNGVPSNESPYSSITEPLLAGVNDILDRCKSFCVHRLAIHASSTSVYGVSALLITGRSGAGKTSIVKRVARMLQDDPLTYTYTLYVDLAGFTDKPVAALKNLFRYWFDTAAWYRPAVLIFDNMEALFGAELEHAESFRTRQLTELFLSYYSSSTTATPRNARGIVVIGTSASQASLHPLLARLHVFSDMMNILPPNMDARKEILTRIVERRIEVANCGVGIDVSPEGGVNFALLATMTEGYLATDLQDLVARAVHEAAMRTSSGDGGISLRQADFEAAQVDFVPLSLRDIKLQKSDIAWSDIGGLQETKRVLRETLEWPTKYGPIFAQSPIRLRSGLLMYGFPGCGKTLLASAIAKECGLNFISVKGPEILNKYIGASEKAVRDLFERASSAKPCVLFFDEFDAIAPKRGHDSTGVTDRVVNQLLTQMDGAEGLEGVYVLAATSRPDLIDSALLRPGRLDKSLFCDMPNVMERQEILEAVALKVIVSPSVDFTEVARMTEGFSGADLQALLYNAHLEVIHASIAADSSSPRKDGMSRRDEPPVRYATFGGPPDRGVASKAEEAALQRRLQQIRSTVAKPIATTAITSAQSSKKLHEITPDHIRKVLQSTRPSVAPRERERLGRIYRAFVSDRTGKFSVPPEAGGVGKRVSLM